MLNVLMQHAGETEGGKRFHRRTPDLTYTAGTKIGTIYSDLGLSDGISKKNVTEYVDGDYAGAFAYDIVKD